MARKITAFRMPPYSARAICSQLFCLALTLLIAALPLAGLKLELAPILTPLGAEPVPLDTSLQLPSGSSFHLPSLGTSGRLVLGPLPSLVLALVFRGDSRLHVTSSGFRIRGATQRPSGRSPPSA